MPNQSGKIVLVLVLLLLILGVVVYFFLPRSLKQNAPSRIQSPLAPSLPTIQSEDKIVRCEEDPSNNEELKGVVWVSLPEKIRDMTFKRGSVSAGEATYQIYPLKWSQDCRHLAFQIELEGRDGGYTDKDYQKRGVYIYDLETKQIDTAMLLPKDLLFDKDEYGSNIWVNNNQYKFVLSKTVKSGEFIKTRYLYDINNKLTKSVE